MRILHLLSQTELTGAEVYAVQLAEEQIRLGHQVLIISDKLHIPHQLDFRPMPVSKRKWNERMKNIRQLKSLIQSESIDIVHAHSRASSWVAHWATKKTKCGYVSTVHGRQHLHFSTKLYSVYGQQSIAVSENIRKHLRNEVGIPEKRLHVVPNGFASFPSSKGSSGIVLAGRTTGPKGRYASEFLEKYLFSTLESYPEPFTIVGGHLNKLSIAAQEQLRLAKEKWPERVNICEYVEKSALDEILSNAKVVIASGRIAIESLAAGKQLIALGEAYCHGWIHSNNYGQAVESNFGDISATADSNVEIAKVAIGLKQIFSGEMLPEHLAEKIKTDFHLTTVCRNIQQIYVQALLEKRAPAYIPILMYHKVVDETFESKHKTYISEKNFQWQLSYLQQKGFTSIQFKDLFQCILENKSLPKKPILLTFDDGYRSMITKALPNLQKFGMKAVFFILADFSIKTNFWDPGEPEPELMSKDEIQTLVNSGMELGGHGFSHKHFPSISYEECLLEIQRSKDILEKEFSTELLSFAYPFGSIDEKSKLAVRNSNIPFGIATDSGGNTLFEDPLEIFRVNIFPQDVGYKFKKKTSSIYRTYYRWKRGK